MSHEDLAAPAAPVAPARRGGPSARTIARVLLVVILLGGMVLGGWVAFDLWSVRGSLLAAQESLQDVRGALGDIDVEEAGAALELADDELQDASSRSGRVTWSIASIVPFVGPTIQVTRDVVEVASAAVDIAKIAVADGRAVLADGLEVQVVDGAVDLDPLLEAHELVAELPIDRLVAARDVLAEPRTGWMPDVVRAGRADTLALADDTVDTLVDLQALTEALPGFLGADGPRRYFVGFQTSAELRGTGGLIGFWGVLSVDDGHIGFGQSETLAPVQDGEAAVEDERIGNIGAIGLSLTNPPDADPAYLARYDTLAGARSFPNINLDPALPTTSKAILDLFELQTDQRLDGVVLLDPVGLQDMLEATGPTLPIGDELASVLGFDDGIPTDQFARLVTADIYATLGSERSNERDDALREIGDAAFLQIFTGRWDARRMLHAITAAATERHLQVYSADTEVQEAFGRVGVTGALEVPVDADQFAIVANNVVGGKQDVHLGHEFDLDLRLGGVHERDDGSFAAIRSGSVGVTVDNPLPSSGMDEYIIGSCYVPDGPNRCFEGEPGSNRTWFSLWASPQTQVVGFESDDGTSPGRYSKQFRGLRVVDYFHLTPAQDRASFAFEVDGPVSLRLTDDSMVYELSWWRQSKAIPDLLDVRIEPPDDWAVGDVEVMGGGSGRGFGVHGEGRELTAEIDDGVAHVQGTVTADTHVLVHLVAP